MTDRPSSKREKFVIVLHRMLTDADAADHSSKFDQICSWMPHGRSFRIHQRAQFEEKILPLYFSGQNKGLTSFQRQLNIYGFTLMTKHALDEGAYYHPHFLRGRPDLLVTIHRKAVKRNCGGYGRSRPDLEPDFYKNSLEESLNSAPVLLPAPPSLVWPHEENPNRLLSLELSEIALNANPASPHYAAADNARSLMTNQVLHLEALRCYYDQSNKDGPGMLIDLFSDPSLSIKSEAMAQVNPAHLRNMASLGASSLKGGNSTGTAPEVSPLLHQEQPAHLPFSLVESTSRDQELIAKQFASYLPGIHNVAFVEHQFLSTPSTAGQYNPLGEARAQQMQQLSFLNNNSFMPSMSPINVTSPHTATAAGGNTLHRATTYKYHHQRKPSMLRNQANAGLVENYRYCSSNLHQDLSERLRYAQGQSSVMADVAAAITRDVNSTMVDNCGDSTVVTMPAAYRTPQMEPGNLTATEMGGHTAVSQGTIAALRAMLPKTGDVQVTTGRAPHTQSHLESNLSPGLSHDSEHNQYLDSSSLWGPSSITTTKSIEERLEGLSISTSPRSASPAVAQHQEPLQEQDWLFYRSRSSSSGDSVHDDHHQYRNNDDNNSRIVSNIDYYDSQPLQRNPLTSIAPAGGSDEEDDLVFVSGDNEGVAYFENDPRMAIEMFHFLQDVDL